MEDEFGHSESSEGIVNHDVFTAQHFSKVEDVHPTDAGVKLVKFDGQALDSSLSPRASVNLLTQPFQSAALLPSYLDKKKKKHEVLYSDRSESPVDDLMDDTPSNYNIINGRLEGKSTGKKCYEPRK